MYQLADMSLDDDEKLDMVTPIAMPDAPEYPYGLRISLTEAEMAKMGIDPAEAVRGGYFMLHALCCVTSINFTDSESGQCCRLEAQIEQATVDGDDEPDADDAPPPATSAAPKGFYKSKGA